MILRKVISSEKGFSLVEILVAIVLLAIAVTPMMGLFTIAPRMHQQREYLLRASYLAEFRLEEVKGLLIAAPDFAAADFNVTAGNFPGAQGFHPFDAGFRYNITHDSGADIKNVTVTVWYSKDGNNSVDAGEQSFQLETRVTKRHP